ncbi:MAG: TolC family protein, partial [Gammaproteobacteria bacterium]|nr:TolC family protein [Gammaproteobacteria bacterium]
AELYQAQLERSKVLYDRNLLLEDLTYKLAGLLAEISANNQSIRAYEKSVNSEKQKVDEAMKRYRSGRIDTDVLIKFEDQLSLASYSLELQRIALVQRNYQLQIVLGTLWNNIKKPEFQDHLNESVGASY